MTRTARARSAPQRAPQRAAWVAAHRAGASRVPRACSRVRALRNAAPAHTAALLAAPSPHRAAPCRRADAIDATNSVLAARLRPPALRGSSSAPAAVADVCETPRHKLRVELSDVQLRGLDEFWKAQGVTKPQQRARLVALARDVLLFRTPSELQARMHTLRTVLWLAAGIYDADVGTMVGRFPRVLRCDIAVSTSLKVAALAAGLPGINLKRLLELNPQLLSLEPKATVLARAQSLAALLPRRDVLRMLELHPPLLSVCTQRTVAPALEALRAALAAHGAEEGCAEVVVERTPRLLTTTPATLASRLALLERLAPGTVAQLQHKPASLARLLCASERALLRIDYVRQTAPQLRLGPTRVVGLPAAAFAERFPGFDAWYDSRTAAASNEAVAR